MEHSASERDVHRSRSAQTRITLMPSFRKGATISSVAAVSVPRTCNSSGLQIRQLATTPSLPLSTTATRRRASFIIVELSSASSALKLARRRVAVVDSGKLGVVANWRICKPEELHVLVTDTAATDEMVAPFLKLGIKVMRV